MINATMFWFPHLHISLLYRDTLLRLTSEDVVIVVHLIELNALIQYI